MIKIHQSQLRELNNDWLIAAQTDFGDWLDQNVGRFGEEWGRTYNLNKGDPDYGCSWWFRDPAKATMTLLRWS